MSKGDEVVRSLFGAVLANQGRGYYVGLELFALLRGTLEGESVLPSPTDEPLRIRRRSHDYARRLMGEPMSLTDAELTELQGPAAQDTLRALARGLRVPIPGRRRRPPWYAEHFQPFVGELIHYDAVYRKARKSDQEDVILVLSGERKRISIERYLYRGAGGLAHMLLRDDSNSARLARTRAGLRKLVEDSGTALGELFAALGRRDKGVDAKEESGGFVEEPEHKARGGYDSSSEWVELLRDGVLRIVERASIPRAKRVEALMHWIPYAIARYQADIACRQVVGEPPTIPVDLCAGTRPIRKLSRSTHERLRAQIVEALEARAQEIDPDLVGRGRSRKWRDSARQFFSGTLSAVGSLNAHTGKRHFVFGNALLESVVLATLDQEMPFDRFCQEVLYDRLRIVVDKRSAASTPGMSRMNRSDFEANSEQLVSRLEVLGMLRKYSDQTRMVHTDVDR